MRPPFKRLWGLAKHERDRRLRQLPDDELLDLAADAYHYCCRRFDENHPPRHGVCRRGTADRFVYYFVRKLVWKLEDYRRWLRRRRADPARYRGPRGDIYDCQEVPQPRSRTVLLEVVNRAIARLGERERELIELRYWEGLSLTAIAGRLGRTDRFAVKRQLDRAHAQLREMILAELGQSITNRENDLGPLAAA